MRILALDPGSGTTGMAVYLDGAIHLSQLDTESIWARLDHTNWDQARASRINAVLVEKYRPVRTSEPGPAEINGAARLLAMRHGAAFREYAPAQSKSLAPNKLLARLGWHDPRLPHAADAARLLVVYALLDCPVETPEQRELVERVRAGVMAGERKAA